ncbi:rho-related GTP-binding protein RhoV-like [Chanos chanos]|uniref:Rho-related GTP-binding protein RhoV-like n=1 Tax=Chanos chanos TaxID=29144 RepID=A0A6J2WIP7_CHACN|nr:rho-related GTP-binding protein RhoV-like [Chanos chanos]
MGFQMFFHNNNLNRPKTFSIKFSKKMDQEPTIRCMLVGDGAVGKTSMIISYISSGFPSNYYQTAFDVYTGKVRVDGTPLKIQLLDTAGQEEYDRFRSLCYPHTDVFLLCFSVVNPDSFHNISTKWIPQLRAHNPTLPIVLVGTQSDLRHDVNVLVRLDKFQVAPVPAYQARRLAEQIQAQDYVECSALTQKSLKEAFDTAIFAAIKHKAHRANRLTFLDRVKTFSSVGWRKLFCFV